MRTVAIFKNGQNQAVRLPKDMEYQNIKELQITKEGDTLILRPAKPGWLSLQALPAADDDFLNERPEIVADQRRF